MAFVQSNVDLDALASRWWMLVVRGLAAVSFGLVAIAAPGIDLRALLLLWGAYALVDGLFGLIFALRAGRKGGRWGWPLFEGIAGILAAIVSFVWPGLTVLVLVTIIAVWAVLTGFFEIVAAVALRRALSGEWLLAASGALSVAVGVFLLAFPDAGARALVTLIGVYALAFGAMLVALGFRFRGATGRGLPASGVPRHA